MAIDLKQAVMRLMDGASFEAHGSELEGTTPDEIRSEIRSLCQFVPPGTNVYVPHGPGEGFEAVTGLAKIFKEEGFYPIPHICARRLNEDEITVGLTELQDHGIDTVMLLGGDVNDSEAGQYKSSSDILHSGLLERTGVKKVLFGGHPDGNRLNPGNDGNDWDVLITKLEDAERKGFETGVVTQVSYSPSDVIGWEKQFREREQLSDILNTRDIKVPVEIGVLGPADLKKKFELAKICGINTPMDVARKVNLKTAVGLAMFKKPDAMITDLANHISVTSTTLRFSTVAQIQDTLCNYVKPIQEGEFSISKNWLGQPQYDIDPA